ncbi:MAG: S9 family peptidase [Planctomycetaceae bacterium]|nr:S9 family peptidase [Planctomycetaceae bacterium]
MALFLSAVVCLTEVDRSLQAQSFHHSTRARQVESRLKSIYERREFRPRNIRIEWFQESGGYALWERDDRTDERTPNGFDLNTGEPTEIDPTDALRFEYGERLSPGKTHVFEERDGEYFVRELATDQRTRLTPAETEGDIYYSDAVWSPDGTQVAFIEHDRSDVRLRPVLVPSDPSYPGVEKHRFARVGETIEKLRVGVASLDGDQTRWLPLDPPEEGFYIGQLAWVPKSNDVLVEKLSRFRDTREFWIYPAEGDPQRLYTETNKAWAIASQGTNLGLNWLDEGRKFLVVSEKDGWRHAFLYSLEGEELAVLTPGEYDIIERSVIDEEGGWYYFYASPENGTQKYLYRVPLDGSGTLERITPADQPGTHDYEFSPDAKWAVHTYSQINMPPVVEIVSIPEHTRLRILEDNAEIQARMDELNDRPVEFLQLEIEEGVSLDAYMVKPRDFDATKKYPVLIYVYGEPHLQTVLDRWGAGQIDFHRVIADQGYLVVSIDNRGTPCPKGADWRRSIFGSLGPLSTEDQAAALQELGRTHAYVDLSRVAIWGWSGGGSNTLNAMFRKPDLYQVGIAVVPKPQPHLYNAWFQEIYMRTREVNAEGYERSAPINFAEGLKGDLLIVTGSGETNTHIQIIEGLVDKLIELGKTFDYMVYPNRDHGLSEGAGTLVHVRMLIVRYLIDHLPAGPR